MKSEWRKGQIKSGWFRRPTGPAGFFAFVALFACLRRAKFRAATNPGLGPARRKWRGDRQSDCSRRGQMPVN